MAAAPRYIFLRDDARETTRENAGLHAAVARAAGILRCGRRADFARAGA
jgi:hypothetical protein